MRTVRVRAGGLAGVAWASLAPVLEPIRRGILDGERAFVGPTTAHVSICDHCNLDCVMCWDHHPGARKPPRRAIDYELFARLLGELAELGTERVNLVGTGEPLLHPRIKGLLRLLGRYEFEVSILTSGVPIGPAMAGLLGELDLCLQLSLHGGDFATWKAVHPGSPRRHFERLREVLPELTRRDNVRLHLQNVISRANVAGIAGIVDYAIEVRADRLTFALADLTPATRHLALEPAQRERLSEQVEAGHARAVAHGIEIEPAFLDRLREREASPFTTREFYAKCPCFIGWVWTSIGRDGSVRPCCNSQLVLGDLNEASFASIWDSEAYRELRRMTKDICTRAEPVPESKCWNCSLYGLNQRIQRLLRETSG